MTTTTRKDRRRGGAVDTLPTARWVFAVLFAAGAIAALGANSPGGGVEASVARGTNNTRAAAPLTVGAAPVASPSASAPRVALAHEVASVPANANEPASRPVAQRALAGALASVPMRAGDRPHLADRTLDRRVDDLVDAALATAARQTKSAANSSNCTVALRVIDLTDGAVVLERQAHTALAPASNMKLVTSLSALVALGLRWNFETHVDAVGALAGGRLRGDLVVRAGGDPLFVEGDPDNSDRRLAELARSIAGNGLWRVDGNLVLDLGPFEDAAPAPGWPTEDPWTSSYGLAAGLTVNGGLVSYRVTPTNAGSRARSEFVPASTGLKEKLDVATVAGRNNDVRLGLYEGSGRLDLVGSIGASLPTYVGDFRHPDPVTYFGEVFRRHLTNAGVEIVGEVLRVRGAPAGTRLGSLSTPWTDYLVPINTYSNNAVAEAVMLAMGLDRFGKASRVSGAERLREVLDSLGTDTTGYVQIDGSGLSRDNRVTVEILSELLARVARSGDELREPFMASLAVAGQTGTLANRMTGRAAGRVHAKTGFINGASALSGFVQTEEGRDLVFSIIVNYPRLGGLNTSCWKPMHDAIVEELVIWKRR